VLHSKTTELTSFKVKRLVATRECALNCLSSVELDVGYSLAAATASVADDTNISDFSAVGLAEEVPDVPFLGFEW
jgi:hypothetical protein